MPFYTQGPEQFSNTQNGGIEDLQSTFGQGVSASIAQGAASTPIAELGDMARHYDESGRGQQLSAEDANQQFGIPGTLKFDAPVSSAVAADLNGAKRRQMLRQDAIDSGPQGIAAGIVRGTAGMIPQFLDPINIGASFVPGLGDARMASLLAEGAYTAERFGAGRVATGLLNQAARTETTGAALGASRAGRLLQGASQGVMGQAALEPLNYAFDRDEHNDWSMGQALGDIAFGGVLGGGLHMLAPHARLEDEPEATVQSLNQPPDEAQMANPMTVRMEAASPDTRGQVTNDAIAALNEDRPNNAESLLQLNEARNLHEELTGWIQQNDRIQSDQDNLLSQAARQDERGRAKSETDAARQADLQRQLAPLREQHAAVSQEAQALRDNWSRMFEDTTSDRLDAIQAEMEQPALPASRRQDLEAERQMLTEGGTSTGDRELEQARTQAQITGLDQQAKRLQSQISRLERRVSDPSVAPDAMAQSAFKAAASRIQSRQDVLYALTHRSLARYASRVQSGISAAGLREMAGRVLTSDNPDEAISGAISDIRNARGPVANHVDQVNQAYVDALRRMADVQGDAANSILRRVQGDDTPEIASARHVGEMQTAGAPRLDRTTPLRPASPDLHSLPLPEGSVQVGRFPSGIEGFPAWPIVLSDGEHDFSKANGGGFGRIHIKERHADQIERRGFKSVDDYVAHILNNTSEIRLDNTGARKSFFAISLGGKTGAKSTHNSAVLHLIQEDGYYRVATAAPFKMGYLKKLKLLWEKVRKSGDPSNSSSNPSGQGSASFTPARETSGTPGSGSDGRHNSSENIGTGASVPQELNDEIAEAIRSVSDLDAQISGIEETDALKNELADITGERQRAEGTAKAYEAATGCMLRNMR
ncbi:coiled-coil domain-containing protein [Gluconobacter oxydans]|uniref:hypothetical protein n=1 Tax=Gluconobacter oxydans TaxID=442 RepID=UPI0007837460|nr:hypothetical protein [Gluconobacter oxydans]KXV13937.1 hypothetical protein AD932_03340 [Gluconobacter oxydans]